MDAADLTLLEGGTGIGKGRSPDRVPHPTYVRARTAMDGLPAVRAAWVPRSLDRPLVPHGLVDARPNDLGQRRTQGRASLAANMAVCQDGVQLSP